MAGRTPAPLSSAALLTLPLSGLDRNQVLFILTCISDSVGSYRWLSHHSSPVLAAEPTPGIPADHLLHRTKPSGPPYPLPPAPKRQTHLRAERVQTSFHPTRNRRSNLPSTTNDPSISTTPTLILFPSRRSPLDVNSTDHHYSIPIPLAGPETPVRHHLI